MNCLQEDSQTVEKLGLPQAKRRAGGSFPPALPDMILFLRSLSIRESNPIWFTQANFPQSCVKMLVNPSGLSVLFPCLTKKFALWKLCDPAHRKIFVFLVRKGAARPTPCKTGNPKRRKFNKCRAYGIRVSNA